MIWERSMAFKILISLEARLDYEEVVNSYFDFTKKLGSRLLSQLRKAQKYIVKNPYQHQIRYNEVRICFLKSFPFGIHYIIEDDVIVILALFHAADNPLKWNKRLKEVKGYSKDYKNSLSKKNE